MSRLKAHPGNISLIMKGSFEAYFHSPFWEKVDFLIIHTHCIDTSDFTVYCILWQLQFNVDAAEPILNVL